ncbi:MAG TPA: GNAT family N-acetyltransferase [Chitinophagaceae bacterium]|nr:GNAT family N-acetyltransferase [Chitinophagaceae bacterium]
MDSIIRLATEEDYPAIFFLIQEFAAFQRTPHKVSNSIEQMRKEKDLFRSIVAEDNGEIVGFASYYFTYFSWTGKAIYLDDLYVVASYRGKGIGRRILEEIISIGKRENCKRLKWQVSKWNEAAISFYKNIGAAIDDTEINCDLLLQ